MNMNNKPILLGKQPVPPLAPPSHLYQNIPVHYWARHRAPKPFILLKKIVLIPSTLSQKMVCSDKKKASDFFGAPAPTRSKTAEWRGRWECPLGTALNSLRCVQATIVSKLGPHLMHGEEVCPP